MNLSEVFVHRVVGNIRIDRGGMLSGDSQQRDADFILHREGAD